MNERIGFAPHPFTGDGAVCKLAGPLKLAAPKKPEPEAVPCKLDPFQYARLGEGGGKTVADCAAYYTGRFEEIVRRPGRPTPFPNFTFDTGVFCPLKPDLSAELAKSVAESIAKYRAAMYRALMLPIFGNPGP